MLAERKVKLVGQLSAVGLLASCLLVASGAAWGAQNSCLACHSSSGFFSKNPRLDAYYKQWIGSTHARSGVKCQSCHGGNPAAAEAGAAHEGVLPVSNPGSRLYFRNQPATCGKCHPDKLGQFRRSKHYAALQGDRPAPTCTTCHPAMSNRPSYKLIVLNACRNCHAPGNPAGLPDIADQAERAFHELNVARGFLGWSTVHFEAQGWPGDSRATLAALDADYDGVVNRVHRFDLDKTGTEASDILARLQAVFDEARAQAEQARKAK